MCECPRESPCAGVSACAMLEHSQPWTPASRGGSRARLGPPQSAAGRHKGCDPGFSFWAGMGLCLEGPCQDWGPESWGRVGGEPLYSGALKRPRPPGQRSQEGGGQGGGGGSSLCPPPPTVNTSTLASGPGRPPQVLLWPCLDHWPWESTWGQWGWRVSLSCGRAVLLTHSLSGAVSGAVLRGPWAGNQRGSEPARPAPPLPSGRARAKSDPGLGLGRTVCGCCPALTGPPRSAQGWATDLGVWGRPGGGGIRIWTGPRWGWGWGGGQDPRRNPISCTARLLWEGLKGLPSQRWRDSGSTTQPRLSGAWGTAARCPGAPALGASGLEPRGGPETHPQDGWHFPATSQLPATLSCVDSSCHLQERRPRRHSTQSSPERMAGDTLHATVRGEEGTPGGVRTIHRPLRHQGERDRLGLWGPGEGT